jgi:hypothetical protein
MMQYFKKVEETKTALKILAFGAHSTGKTTFALTFPEIAAIDTEDGMAFYKKNKNIKLIFTTSSAIKTEKALEEAIRTFKNTGIKTVVLDTETKIYENLQHSALEVAEKRAAKNNQDAENVILSQREWGRLKLIGKRIKSKQIMLAKHGINIISIAQEKELKKPIGNNDYLVIGYAPDCQKKIEHDFDIVLRFYTKVDNQSKNVNYYAEVYKDRTGQHKKGDIIQSPTFDCWKKIYDEHQSLKEDIINFNSDIDTDASVMTSMAETDDAVIKEFTKRYTKLKDEEKANVKKLIEKEEIDILKHINIDKLATILDQMR